MNDFLLPGLMLVLAFMLAYGTKLIQYLKKQIILHKQVNVLPGDRWFPFVGTTWRFFGIPREETWDLVKKLTKQYGPTWRMWSGSTPLVFISKAEHLEAAMKNNVNLNKGQTYEYLRPWLGDGLVTASKTKWKGNRKLLTPLFHFKVLNKYGEVFTAKGQQLADIFAQFAGGDYVDVFPYLVRCGFDIISETAMGVKFDTLKNPDSKYCNAVFSLCKIAALRPRNFFLRNNFFFKISELGKEQEKSLKLVLSTNMKIIADKKIKFQTNKSKPKNDDSKTKETLAFLDLLLESQEENKFTEKEICDEVSTFMVAGQDTTSVTITAAMLALGNNLEIQAKVHEELDRIFGGEERSVTPQDLASMDLLDRVIKETLRMFSPIPIIGRTLDQAIEIDGKTIPAGVTLNFCLYAVHRDPKHWPNPDKFDPDRFLSENSATRHPFAFVPFSAGARNCIGQKFSTRNSKTILASVFRKFEITCLESMENWKEYNETVLKPQNGLHVKFKLRNQHKK